MRRVGGRGMVQVGLLGHSGGGARPNPPQRRPATGSAARRSAEYQRFSFGASAEPGSLWQIWATRAAADPRDAAHGGVRRSRGVYRRATSPGRCAWGRTGPHGGLVAEMCILHSRVQFQPSFSSAKCTSRVQSAHLGEKAPARAAYAPVRSVPGSWRGGKPRASGVRPRAQRPGLHRRPRRHPRPQVGDGVLRAAARSRTVGA